MNKTINLLKLLPVVLLSACTTSYPPQDTTSAPELPHRNVLVQQPDNCSVGCPQGGSQQTIYRHVYTLNNNSATKFANWVAYSVTKTSQASGRPRNWAQDPDLPPSDTLAPSAYKNAHTLLKVDRGHQAPLAGLGGVSDWPSLNYLSNITPQKSALNQGAWAALENRVRELAKQADVSVVHVVTGPLFERHIATLPEDATVEIPSGYWKVLFTGTAPSKSEGNYAAFIMDQNTPRSANFCDYQVTVEAIEHKTKPVLTLWSALPEAVASEVKTCFAIRHPFATAYPAIRSYRRVKLFGITERLHGSVITIGKNFCFFVVQFSAKFKSNIFRHRCCYLMVFHDLPPLSIAARQESINSSAVIRSRLLTLQECSSMWRQSLRWSA